MGIIEKDGGIYNSNGFDPNDVKLFMSQGMGKSITQYHNAEEIQIHDADKIMFKPCDIFAPCAGDGTLNANNAGSIQAKIVIEGANGPTTFAADKILAKNGVQVIPDMLANVGGVTVSYFEWLKNLDHVAPGRMTAKHQEQTKKKLVQMLGYKFPETSPIMKELKGAREIDIVTSALEEIMTSAAKENWNFARKRNLTLREACLGNALKKLQNHYDESGLMLS